MADKRPRKQTRIVVEAIVDADVDEFDRSVQFAVTSFKGACRNLRKDVSAVTLLIFDDNGVEIGADTTGTLSPAASAWIQAIKEEAAAEAAEPV